MYLVNVWEKCKVDVKLTFQNYSFDDKINCISGKARKAKNVDTHTVRKEKSYLAYSSEFEWKCYLKYRGIYVRIKLLWIL